MRYTSEITFDPFFEHGSGFTEHVMHELASNIGVAWYKKYAEVNKGVAYPYSNSWENTTSRSPSEEILGYKKVRLQLYIYTKRDIDTAVAFLRSLADKNPNFMLYEVINILRDGHTNGVENDCGSR